jgi:hypothetical protein
MCFFEGFFSILIAIINGTIQNCNQPFVWFFSWINVFEGHSAALLRI